jgi:hypothetical protein
MFVLIVYFLRAFCGFSYLCGYGFHCVWSSCRVHQAPAPDHLLSANAHT